MAVREIRPPLSAALVAEELGELQQALLQIHFEPSKGKTADDVREEAVQTAAMALRFLSNFDRYSLPQAGSDAVSIR